MHSHEMQSRKCATSILVFLEIGLSFIAEKKKVLIHISLLFRVILIYLRRYLLRLLIYLLYLHFLRNEQKI